MDGSSVCSRKSKKHKASDESNESLSKSKKTDTSLESFAAPDTFPSNLAVRLCRKPPRSYKT